MLLEVRWETKRPFLVGKVILEFLSIFKKSQALSPFEALNSTHLLRYQKDVIPLYRWGGNLGLSLGSSQGIQTSLHLMRWKMSLHLSHCREIRPSFESGHLGIHSTWDRNHRVPLTYVLLTENCSWGGCGKLELQLHLKTGKQLSSWDDMGCTELSSSCCTEIDVPLELRRMSQGISGVS